MFLNVRRVRTLAAALTLLAMLFVMAGCGGSSSKAVAEVNGQKITRAELDTYINVLRLFMPNLEPMLGEPSRRSALEGQILEAMIENLLVEQLVRENGLTVTAEEINAVYEAQKSQIIMMAGGTQEELNKKLTELKVKEDDVKAFVGGSAYVDALVSFLAESVTEEEVAAFFAENPKKGVILELSHILVETEEEALAAQERLQNGEDFAALAKELSKCPSAQDGGYLDKIAADAENYDQDFLAGAGALEVDEISPPVQSQFGWHLILLHSREMPDGRMLVAEEKMAGIFAEFSDRAEKKINL